MAVRDTRPCCFRATSFTQIRNRPAHSRSALVRWVRLSTLVFVLSAAVARAAEDTPLPPGDFVARVYYGQASELAGLAEYDVHEYNNLKEQFVRVSANREIFERLKRAGWRVSLDAEATAALEPVTPMTFSGGYRTVDELYASLAATVSNYPAITELATYGQSFDKVIGGDVHGGHALGGYDLKAIRVTNRQIPGPKPVFFLMAGIHAREITTPEVAMRMLDWLVRGYGTNADATWLVDYHETWILPTTNPDGHWLVELGGASPYYQRKNAHRAGSTYWPPNAYAQYGVDCNRNSSFKWDTGGTSTDPLDQTYLGTAAASEPEVSALQNFIRTLIPDQRGPADTDVAPDSTAGILITLHSYGDEVLWPWGYTSVTAPNATGLAAIGMKFASYNHYTAMQSIGLYPTSGTTDDWAYGELGIPAYTIEMGPTFMPAYSAVDAIQWSTNRNALVYAAKIARTPYVTVRGPDALNLTSTPTAAGVIIAATIDDRNNGNLPIQAAECTVDLPWWANATPIAMSASDGAFGSTVESVQATLPLASAQNGKHIVFVRGQNSGGNWGPPSAIFFDLRTSAPVLSASLLDGHEAVVSWESVTNLAYTLMFRTNLQQTWSDTTFTNVPGTGGLMAFTNQDSSESVFFRLKAIPRP